MLLNKFFDGYFNVKINVTVFQTLSWSVLPLFLKVNLFAPVLEELAFRLPLFQNQTKLLIGAIFLFFVVPLTFKGGFASQSCLIILSIGTFYYVFLLFFQFRNKLLTIYFSSLIFGLAHLVNYPLLSLDNIIPTLFDIIPQMICGILLAKLRLSRGLLYSIYFHIIINLIISFFQIWRT